MSALVIGGTRFVGAAIVDALIERGASVTLFSRGKTNPGLYPELEHVRGDRRTDLGRLGERRFDVIFDSCGYIPADVEPAAELARDLGAFYVFVSSASAYGELAGVDSVSEGHPLAVIDSDHDVTARENYGAAKVLCEETLTESLGARLAITRPGLIAGPRDYTGRYPYWVARLGLGGSVLCPGDGADPAQILDARDFAAFMVGLAETEASGVFNAADGATFADLIESATPPGRDPELVWAPAEFLAANDVAPWKDMPCWLPRDHESAAMLRLDTSRARAAGLKTRSWRDIAADTRRWLEDSGRRLPFEAGLSSERERELIAALR